MKDKIEAALTAFGIKATVIQVGEGDFVIDDAKLNSSAQMGHSVPPGKSLVEKLRDDLDESFSEFSKTNFVEEESERSRCYGLVEGIAHSLGVIRGSSADFEWNEAKSRYENRAAKSVEQ